MTTQTSSRLWKTLRPWLGFGTFIYEAVQPLFDRDVEPLIIAGAVAMMGLELLSRADTGSTSTPPPTKEPREERT